MEILMDSLKVIGRIVTILPSMLVIALFIGKRSIGELPVFDVLVILVLGTVVGADIADPEIGHIHTFVAIIAIALLHRGITLLKLKKRRIGKMITFEPTIVVYKGQFLHKNIKRINYSLDNLLQMLREKDVFQMSNVELAIIEASGRMSVSLKPDKLAVTAGDLGLPAKEAQFEIPLILDGEIQKDALTKLNLSTEWLTEQLHVKKITDKFDVFYAGVDANGNLNITLKNQVSEGVPPINH
ncbi:DUF421 domain-containing protein [Bacillus sp. B15-48]|uniref:YetF domain-containing protein n=1 Tax=Bacillus sp. B15-48 TaxID=1548601 RepID=UPI00193FF5D0|nr:DUF421 domain-containing protein [Bacillus sp. B15-48]MBM4760928.1 DUF421 domain-containing protein [Bacillus sp. B15-48]